MSKKNLLISFSGGETSAFMAQWLRANMSDKYEMKTVFANTGEENEATLEFVRRCDEYFGLDCVWVECITDPQRGKGVSAKVVTFDTANRKGEPFEAMVAKHGIPNQNFSHCSRELKERTIKAYLRSIGWKGYYTAIGIRADEFDRMSPNSKKEKKLYPLISACAMTKPEINSYWSKMPFRLELKGYQGNCKVCWKKSLRKLMTIAKENPEKFETFRLLEEKYQYYTAGRKNATGPFRFYRGNLSVQDIIDLSKQPFEVVTDDSTIYSQCTQTSLFGHDLDLASSCEEGCGV